MTQGTTTLTNEEIMAALANEARDESDLPDDAQSSVRQETLPTEETPVEKTTLQDALKPLMEELEKVKAAVAYNNRTQQPIPPEVTARLEAIQTQQAAIIADNEQLKLRDMSDAERADYYQKKAETIAAAKVVVPPPPQPDPTKLPDQAADYFETTLGPQLEEIGASLGRSVKESQDFFATAKVWPIVDGQTGKVIGYDWTRLTTEFTKEMASRNAAADAARSTNGGNGDGKKAGGGIPKGLDPLDPKQSVSTMLMQALAAKAF